MNTTLRVVPALLVITVATLTAACGKKPAPAPAPVTARDTAAENAARRDEAQRESARRNAEAAAARQRFVDDSIARVRAADEAAQRETEMLKSAVATDIMFEFNRADLRADARAALDAKIPILLANAGVAVVVAGHADERGSTEYNLALGAERAASAKRYLVERGVPGSRIETTSFGEERPICTDAGEDCWSRNRRDEFIITTGSARLAKPGS